ncbi:MAG: hypothetical protein SGARI_006374 [Bacillariaceae sp.]
MTPLTGSQQERTLFATHAQEDIQMHFSVVTPGLDVYSSYNEMDNGAENDVEWKFTDVGGNRHVIQIELIGSLDPGEYQYILSGSGGAFLAGQEEWMFWIHSSGVEMKSQTGTSVDLTVFNFTYQGN